MSNLHKPRRVQLPTTYPLLATRDYDCPCINVHLNGIMLLVNNFCVFNQNEQPIKQALQPLWNAYQKYHQTSPQLARLALNEIIFDIIDANFHDHCTPDRQHLPQNFAVKPFLAYNPLLRLKDSKLMEFQPIKSDLPWAQQYHFEFDQYNEPLIANFLHTMLFN